MSIPGRLLSQPASSTVPSSRSACTTVSTESAMTSRLTSEKCIPTWPIEMPSDTEIVPNSIGKPPARCTPSLAAWARRCSDRLHGVISFHDDAMPICGLAKSSSRMPTARSIPRAAARSSPSVTSRERGLRSCVVGLCVIGGLLRCASATVCRCPGRRASTAATTPAGSRTRGSPVPSVQLDGG